MNSTFGDPERETYNRRDAIRKKVLNTPHTGVGDKLARHESMINPQVQLTKHKTSQCVMILRSLSSISIDDPQ